MAPLSVYCDMVTDQGGWTKAHYGSQDTHPLCAEDYRGDLVLSDIKPMKLKVYRHRTIHNWGQGTGMLVVSDDNVIKLMIC